MLANLEWISLSMGYTFLFFVSLIVDTVNVRMHIVHEFKMQRECWHHMQKVEVTYRLPVIAVSMVFLVCIFVMQVRVKQLGSRGFPELEFLAYRCNIEMAKGKSWS